MSRVRGERCSTVVDWKYDGSKLKTICFSLDTAGFDTSILPTVAKAGSKAGHLHDNWFGIDKGCDVFVAMGDMQCSVRTCNVKTNEAGKL